MRAYLAAAYRRKDEIHGYALALRAIGVEVVSTWDQEDYAPTVALGEVPGPVLAAIAEKDLRDLHAADTLIFFTEPQDVQPPRGGRHVEFGIALALGHRLIVVGERENIFHHLPQVEVIQHISEIGGI